MRMWLVGSFILLFYKVGVGVWALEIISILLLWNVYEELEPRSSKRAAEYGDDDMTAMLLSAQVLSLLRTILSQHAGSQHGVGLRNSG